MTRANRILGVVVASAITLGIRWASTAALAPPGGRAATLRLAWSARPERIETCRPATVDELAGQSAHMRRKVICTGTSAAYRLEVRRDDAVIVSEIVHGGGWRRDRPIHVFHEIPQPAGNAEIEVTFERIGNGDEDAASIRPGPSGRPAPHVPASLALEEQLRFEPGRVILVTYDAERQTFVSVRD